MPTRATLDETASEIAGLIRKLGAKTLDFGYFVDGPDPDREPEPEEVITWWAKAQHRGGPLWTAEVRCQAMDLRGPIDVLAELARKMGGNVRIRWEEV